MTSIATFYDIQPDSTSSLPIVSAFTTTNQTSTTTVIVNNDLQSTKQVYAGYSLIQSSTNSTTTLVLKDAQGNTVGQTSFPSLQTFAIMPIKVPVTIDRESGYK